MGECELWKMWEKTKKGRMKNKGRESVRVGEAKILRGGYEAVKQGRPMFMQVKTANGGDTRWGGIWREELAITVQRGVAISR